MEVQSHAKTIVHVDVARIKPHPRNSNHHSKEQLERLAKIIRYSGFRQPLVVSNLSGFLISGHGRLDAAKSLGMSQVPVIYEDFEDEAMEFQHLTADNAIAAWAELDLDKTKADALELELNTNGFDLDLLGVPDLILTKVDEAILDGSMEKEKDQEFKVEVLCVDGEEMTALVNEMTERGMIAKAIFRG